MLFPTINRWCRLLTALNKLAITFLHWGCKDTETYDYIPQPVNMNFPNINLHIESYAVQTVVIISVLIIILVALCLAYCVVMAALPLAYCVVMAALPLIHDIALVAVHEAYGT